MPRLVLIASACGAALSLSACASNYGAEGGLAGAAGGALIGAAAGNTAAGAAIGAAAGAAIGSTIRKDGRCYRRDDRGYEYEVRC